MSTESRRLTQGVNENEPIENMQLYMGYSLEKLKRRLQHRLGINNGRSYAHAQTSNAYNFCLS